MDSVLPTLDLWTLDLARLPPLVDLEQTLRGVLGNHALAVGRVGAGVGEGMGAEVETRMGGDAGGVGVNGGDGVSTNPHLPPPPPHTPNPP
jgi:hypothetical protein